MAKTNLFGDASLLTDARKASKLPYYSNAKVVWQAVAVPMRFWVADQHDQVCRPYNLLLLEIYPRGKVIHYAVHSPAADPPLPVDYAKFIVKYMLDPGAGEERARPRMISFVDSFLQSELAPLMDILKVEVKTLVVADGVEEFVRKLSEGIVEKGKATRGDAAERPGLLASTGITVDMMKDFMVKCVRFFRSAPWDDLEESLALEISFPRNVSSVQNPLYGTILGSTKKIQGLTLMASLSALRAKYRSVMSANKGSSVESNGDNGILDELLCAFCGKRTGEVDQKDGGLYVNRCGGCKRLLYCDKCCQKQDWAKRHRNECQRAKDTDYVFKRDEWAWMRRELAVLFVDPTAMPFDDLDAIEKHSMPVIDERSPPLYPISFVTTTSSGLHAKKMTRPTVTELLILSMTCDALVEYDTGKLSKEVMRLPNGLGIKIIGDLASL